MNALKLKPNRHTPSSAYRPPTICALRDPPVRVWRRQGAFPYHGSEVRNSGLMHDILFFHLSSRVLQSTEHTSFAYKNFDNLSKKNDIGMIDFWYWIEFSSKNKYCTSFEKL